MTKKITKIGEISWIVGNIICSLGNLLVSKSAFGLSAVIAPAFILNRAEPSLSVGVCEYITQGILLALCCIVIGKFKGKFIATICNILFYGACFDTMDSLFAFYQPTTLVSRMFAAALGTVLICFAIALMLRTYIPPSAYEIFVKEIALAKKIDLSKMKLLFDSSMLLITILFMFLFLRGFYVDILGPMTVIAAFLNSALIGYFGRIIDKYCEFTPAIPKLYKLLNRD